MTSLLIVWIVVAALSGLVAGGVLAGLWLRSRNAQLVERLAGAERQRETDTAELRDARDALNAVRADKAGLAAKLEAEQAHAADKLKALTEAREQLTHQFKTLSQEILEEKSQRFTEQNRASLEPLLTPLKDHIGRFEKQVRQAYDEEGRQRSALAQQIRMLEASNKAIAEDALNLTNALKGESKTQGNWGEMILETVLERSGLIKGTQYETQFSAVSEEGKRQLPDALVHLPEARCIVIDSKVSLTAYVQVHEADTEDGRRAALSAHLDSVRRHLKQLSAKNYQGLPQITTLDYVFMFIPSEAAYVEALRGDFELQREALDKNIALVSPTTLMPMLRAISNLWRLQRQEENAAEIANKAGALYDKFVGFLEDMDKLGRALSTADKSYENARKKLVDGSGNIVRRTQHLKKLGAATGKRIGEDWRNAGELGAQRGDAVDDGADLDEDAADDMIDDGRQARL